jgi:hypothetical protein
VSNLKDTFEAASAPNFLEAAEIHSVRVSPDDEKTILSFYENTWNSGDKSGFEAHPQIAEKCAKDFDKYTGIFPDLQIHVKSMEQRHEEILVNWTAEGTPANALDGASKESVDGLTLMKIQNGEIISARAAWDDRGLEQRLSERGVV